LRRKWRSCCDHRGTTLCCAIAVAKRRGPWHFTTDAWRRAAAWFAYRECDAAPVHVARADLFMGLKRRNQP